MLRQDARPQDGGSEVPDAAEHEEAKAMRGASEGQEGTYLVRDVVNVLSGVEKLSEGQEEDREAASLDEVLVALRAFVDALDNLKEVITRPDADTGNR